MSDRRVGALNSVSLEKICRARRIPDLYTTELQSGTLQLTPVFVHMARADSQLDECWVISASL